MLKTLLIKIPLLIFGLYLLILLLFYLAQRSLLYFPTPATKNIIEQPISFSHQGQSLNGWVINPGQNKALLYYGGNAEQIEQNISQFKALAPDHSVYLINYRGYGQSSGSPSEQALFDDALFIYDQIKPQHQQLSAMGRSLGSGVAVHLAANRAIEQLILVTPYNSITDVASHHYPWLPVKWLIKDPYDSASKAPQVKSNTLILVANFDQIIPPQFAHQLAGQFNQAQIQLVTLDNASHNDIDHFPQYQQLLGNFLSH